MNACSSSGGSKSIKDSDKIPTKTVGGSVTLQPLFYTETVDGFKGGTSDITLELEVTDTKEIRVAISDDEVQGSGPQWEAAAWNAMAVSTLITGASLDKRQFQVNATGFIDGPSAGALMTIGAISLIRGDKIDPDVTMTGTINPDGTIGPVGGIQYKLDGASKAGKEIVLIPTGQLNEEDENGNVIDLKSIGDDLGLEVKEVDNVYTAYKEFTGETLPRFSSDTDPELTDEQVDALSDIVKDYQRKYLRVSDALPAFTPNTEGLAAWLQEAEDGYQESKTLERTEKPAAALGRIRDSYSEILSIDRIIEYDKLFTSAGGLAGENFIIEMDENFRDDFDTFAQTLEDYEPETLGHAANLIDSYGVATVAVGLEKIAVDQMQSQTTPYDPITVISYLQTASAGLEIQSELFDAFSDVDGPDISKDTDPEIVAKFFRQGADANIASFKTTIVSEVQAGAGVSAAEAEALLGQADPSVALVLNSQEIERSAEELFGKIDNLAYAKLGAAVELYARSSELIAGYYSLGIPSFQDGQISIVDFRSEKAFRSAKRLAKDQLAGVGSVLADKGVEPVFVANAFELASQDDSSSDPQEAIYSLRIYWKGFVAGRVLTYLGGFPRAGLEN